MFIAGIGPGLLIAIALLVMVQIWCRLKGYGLHDKPVTTSVWAAFLKAFWALLLPVIVIGGIYGGVFTPTEAAAVSAVYAFFIGVFVYKELSFRDLPRVFKSAVLTTNGHFCSL